MLRSNITKGIILLNLLLIGSPAFAAILQVGPGKPFNRIEEAYERAKSGDTIYVYPRQNNTPYEKMALLVKKKNIKFMGVTSEKYPWVKISGKSFNYIGKKEIPRAIFQFEKGADNCLVEGFELFEARNATFNGAGVRINKANNVTVKNCNIHDNDMGMMSNGDGSGRAAVNQKIEHCVIHHNGTFLDPGQNHNLYLGGQSARISFCDIYSSLTGHNVKSRAHFTLIEYCYIHDAANREIDLVDSDETTRPGSDAVLTGNVIIKDPACEGNKQVVYFGQDGEIGHNGTIYLVHNTIVTPFPGVVLVLSARGAKAKLIGNLICDDGTGTAGQAIASTIEEGQLKNVTGEFNVFGSRFRSAEDTHLSGKGNIIGFDGKSAFINPSRHDYRPAKPLPRGWPAPLIMLPKFPDSPKGSRIEPLVWQYLHQAKQEKRPEEKKLTVGAYSATK